MTDPSRFSIAKDLIAGLRGLGYSNSLLQEEYGFTDWFSVGSRQERTIRAAAFGQTPISYDTALIGIALSNGVSGSALVNSVRALGAPILLEIDGRQIHEWAVSGSEHRHVLLGTFAAERMRQLLVERASEWQPELLLRAKNLGSFRWARQLELFAGLVPELESHIQGKLDPLLRSTLSSVRDAYVNSTGLEPKPEALFRLVFWILTAKVFYDRRVRGFIDLEPDPDILLDLVSAHYKLPPSKPLNRVARETAAKNIWADLDFRNLSVDVLSQIWSTTLVDEDTRKRLGIHRTSRAIVRYIVERIPFPMSGDDRRIVFEPCCGSAGFLIGAMNHLRPSLFGTTPKERHAYFVKRLAGLEHDPFGVEISRLALTLADFPNPDGWRIERDDVFTNGSMTEFLQQSGVVLCNPPFQDFNEDERNSYTLSSFSKPIELLTRILRDLHPTGVLGFVLPRLFADGKSYGTVRSLLANRFASIELTVLPDKAFEADAEVVLLIAHDPIPHESTRVFSRRVDDNQSSWDRFARGHEVSSEFITHLAPAQAEIGLLAPELPSIWEFLENHRQLEDVTSIISRGVRWKKPMIRDRTETGNREIFVRKDSAPGFIRGVAPQTKFNVFEIPQMSFLSVLPEDRDTNAWKLPWPKNKVVLNKSTRSRGHWRISAFPDTEGVSCYQTYIAIWPKADRYDSVVLAAILNSPLANAFVSSREGKTDVTIETLKKIPIPSLNSAQQQRIRELVARYQSATYSDLFTAHSDGDPETLLKEIDASVLDGYRLPPRLERELLDYFRGHQRPTAHPFGAYIPDGTDISFSLSKYLLPHFGGLSAVGLLGRMGRQRHEWISPRH